MYEQIYTIIRDAVFGVAELTSYQAFTLEQLATILCVVVLLVPIVVPAWLIKRWLGR